MDTDKTMIAMMDLVHLTVWPVFLLKSLFREEESVIVCSIYLNVRINFIGRARHSVRADTSVATERGARSDAPYHLVMPVHLWSKTRRSQTAATDCVHLWFILFFNRIVP
jgi:hypothetical protein